MPPVLPTRSLYFLCSIESQDVEQIHWIFDEMKSFFVRFGGFAPIENVFAYV